MASATACASAASCSAAAGPETVVFLPVLHEHAGNGFPWSCNNRAETDESTPPDMATMINSCLFGLSTHVSINGDCIGDQKSPRTSRQLRRHYPNKMIWDRILSWDRILNHTKNRG